MEKTRTNFFLTDDVSGAKRPRSTILESRVRTARVDKTQKRRKQLENSHGTWERERREQRALIASDNATLRARSVEIREKEISIFNTILYSSSSLTAHSFPTGKIFGCEMCKKGEQGIFANERVSFIQCFKVGRERPISC